MSKASAHADTRYSCSISLGRSGRAETDVRRIAVFLERWHRYGLDDQCAVLLGPSDKADHPFEAYTVHGVNDNRLRDEMRDADAVWSLGWSLNSTNLQHFKRSVLLDGDPGLLQVSALAWDLKLNRYDALFTSGMKINDDDCEIPKLNLDWKPFFPPIHLPAWTPSPGRSPNAAITSITQWNWAHEFRLVDRVYSDSKRDAYLRYLRLPQISPYPFELAANLRSDDGTGDCELLKIHGWTLVSPHLVARTPAAYQHFIQNSSCEFGCAKPIYVDLKTGWFSERSATYLACGRPVVAENTGFTDHIETGIGLLAFSNLDEAKSAVDRVMSNYSLHQKAARELAEAYFSADRILPQIIQGSF